MKQRKRHSRYSRHTSTILLAYAHRYAFPMLTVILPLVLLKKNIILGMGIGFMFDGLYTLVGYLCRWKHIYCSYQNAHHQEMTPDDIRWHRIRKSDAYGLPALSMTMGLLMIICHFFGL